MAANTVVVTSLAGAAVTLSSTDVGAGVQAAHHRVCDATAANFMPTADAAARALFAKITDGTNTMPTMDAAARPGFQKITDGTNTMPTMDAAARPGFVKLTDGTGTATFDNGNTTPKVSLYGKGTAAGDTAVNAGDTQAHGVNVVVGDGTSAGKMSSLANLQAFSGANSLLVERAGEKVATDSIVTGTTTPDAQLAAPGSGKIYVVHTISITLAATVDQVPLLFKLVQDAGGTPVTLWQGSLAALAKTTSQITLTGLSIPQTVANKALDLSVITGTIASTNYIQVNIGATVST